MAEAAVRGVIEFCRVGAFRAALSTIKELCAASFVSVTMPKLYVCMYGNTRAATTQVLNIFHVPDACLPYYKDIA